MVQRSKIAVNSRTRRRWWWGFVALVLMAPLFFPMNYLWRATRPWVYKDLIDRHARALNFDPLFVMAVVRVESGFSHSALSHRGAVGLMQLMPQTARETAPKIGLNAGTMVLRDPDTNIRVGVKYLDVLRQEFGDDTVAVLAAYNAGPGKVREWRRGPVLALDDISYGETRSFVRRVLMTQRWFQRLKKIKGYFHA
jgi:soluble lytic murein transglycosylase